MNRIEFMTELAALLQDVPEEERRDAMQFYNDYFDDAGEDKESEVISELESPKKVAEKIKADLLGQQAEREYTETGCRDGSTDGRSMPVKKAMASGGCDYESSDNGQSSFRGACGTDSGNYGYQEYRYDGEIQDKEEQKPWSSNILKVILIIAIILVGAPIIIPCALAIVLVAVACIVVRVFLCNRNRFCSDCDCGGSAGVCGAYGFDTRNCSRAGSDRNGIDTWSDRSDWNSGRGEAVYCYHSWYMQGCRMDF